METLEDPTYRDGRAIRNTCYHCGAAMNYTNDAGGSFIVNARIFPPKVVPWASFKGICPDCGKGSQKFNIHKH